MDPFDAIKKKLTDALPEFIATLSKLAPGGNSPPTDADFNAYIAAAKQLIGELRNSSPEYEAARIEAFVDFYTAVLEEVASSGVIQKDAARAVRRATEVALYNLIPSYQQVDERVMDLQRKVAFAKDKESETRRDADTKQLGDEKTNLLKYADVYKEIWGVAESELKFLTLLVVKFDDTTFDAFTNVWERTALTGLGKNKKRKKDILSAGQLQRLVGNVKASNAYIKTRKADLHNEINKLLDLYDTNDPMFDADKLVELDEQLHDELVAMLRDTDAAKAECDQKTTQNENLTQQLAALRAKLKILRSKQTADSSSSSSSTDADSSVPDDQGTDETKPPPAGAPPPPPPPMPGTLVTLVEIKSLEDIARRVLDDNFSGAVTAYNEEDYLKNVADAMRERNRAVLSMFKTIKIPAFGKKLGAEQTLAEHMTKQYAGTNVLKKREKIDAFVVRRNGPLAKYLKENTIYYIDTTLLKGPLYYDADGKIMPAPSGVAHLEISEILSDDRVKADVLAYINEQFKTAVLGANQRRHKDVHGSTKREEREAVTEDRANLTNGILDAVDIDKIYRTVKGFSPEEKADMKAYATKLLTDKPEFREKVEKRLKPDSHLTDTLFESLVNMVTGSAVTEMSRTLDDANRMASKSFNDALLKQASYNKRPIDEDEDEDEDDKNANLDDLEPIPVIDSDTLLENVRVKLAADKIAFAKKVTRVRQ